MPDRADYSSNLDVGGFIGPYVCNYASARYGIPLSDDLLPYM